MRFGLIPLANIKMQVISKLISMLISDEFVVLIVSLCSFLISKATTIREIIKRKQLYKFLLSKHVVFHQHQNMFLRIVN